MKTVKNIFMVMFMLSILFVQNVMASTYQGVVNINTATQEELVKLPGIGGAKAMAIIQQRKNKKFTNKQELLLVKGIGESIYKKISTLVTLQGQTNLKKTN